MDKYAIVRRRYSREKESDEYEALDYSDTLEAAKEVALSSTGESGDILIICETAKISDIRNNLECIYFLNEFGEICDPTPVDGEDDILRFYEFNWLQFWEGEAFCDEMIHAATLSGVNVKKICMATYSCIKILVDSLPKDIDVVFKTLDCVRRWFADEATDGELEGASDSIWGFYNHQIDIDGSTLHKYELIIKAVAHLSDASMFSEHTFSSAIGCSVNSLVNSNELSREFSEIIRSIIPLREVLLCSARKASK